MKKEQRECPHCHGSLDRYEDPKAVEIIAKLAKENDELKSIIADMRITLKEHAPLP